MTEEERRVVLQHFVPGYYKRQLVARGLAVPERLLAHYLNTGWRQGLEPSPEFSGRRYLDVDPDARTSGMSPLEHWARVGRHRDPAVPVAHPAELGRLLAAFIDPDYYRAQFAADAPDDAVAHYLEDGWRAGVRPSPWFDAAWYVERNPDVSTQGPGPLAHWIRVGVLQGLPGASDSGAVAAAGPAPAEPAMPPGAENGRALFDEAYYRAQLDPDEEVGDPYLHYLELGWRRGLDPTPLFSTRFYLTANRDIAAGGINPYLHWVNFGRAEKRTGAPYWRMVEEYRPLVSVIVPNYNHARFLEQRLGSIFAQSYRHVELLVLDDASTDDSRAVIARLLARSPFPTRTIFNDERSGNPFRQWRRGLEAARGELVWICESDDFADPRFLEQLVPHFVEQSVMVALGRIEFADADGEERAGMAAFREGAEPGIWNAPVTRTAAEWFAGPWAFRNIAANVGGCLFRAQPVDAAIWEAAARYRIAGDWFLYLHLVGTGKLAFDPGAVAWFRQHGANTSASNFDKLYYYDECWAVQREVRRHWAVSPAESRRVAADLERQWRHWGMEAEHGPFAGRYDVAGLDGPVARRPHVLVGSMGFQTGGGELFPVVLANELRRQGAGVSLFAMSMGDANPDTRARLDPRVPVYSAEDVHAGGRAGFLAAAGVDVVHSHNVTVDNLFFPVAADPLGVPYVVSMHGSHNLPPGTLDALLFRALGGVDLWIYTADANLRIFGGIPLDPARLVKMPNAMPRDERAMEGGRAALGIADDALLFLFVARGIRRKGWRAAVDALALLKERRPDLDAQLLMVGEGEAAEDARRRADGRADVHFLGYQSCINGLYRISDCALVPTRFQGESFPLCIVQALQEGCPAVASAVGEIPAILGDAGLLVEPHRDTRAFAQGVADAMERIADPAVRATLADRSRLLGHKFDIARVAGDYLALYERARALHPA